MAITNISAVKFSNERVRPLADTLARALRQLEEMKISWESKELTNYFPNDINEVVDDGSDVDGRTTLTSADIVSFVEMCQTLVGFAAQTNNQNRNLIYKISVNP